MMKQWSILGSVAPRVKVLPCSMPGKAAISPVGMSAESVTWWRLVKRVASVPSMERFGATVKEL